MNEYKVDDFGEARLLVSRKGCNRHVTCFGTIKAVEKKVVLFTDNDGFSYLVDKKDFNFTKEIFKDFNISK